MMAGNPNWWNMHPPSLIPLGVGSSSSSSSSIPPLNFLAETQEVPTQYSWSQMLFAGLPGEEERMGMSQYFETKKLENWEEEDEEQNIIVNNNNNNSNPSSSSSSTSTSIRASVNVDDVIKQEVSQNGNLYGHDHQQFQMASNSAPPPPPPHASISYNNWSNNNINNTMVPLITSSNHNFSPNSRAITSLINNTSNVLDFTYHKKPEYHRKIQPASQCNNSTSSGGVCNKKARVHSSPSQPPLKVRKEKLGDRITALHQLVSPFGKTDTASVLLEAIGYIRFLQTQIQALSSPYLAKASKNMRNQHSVHGERNAVFPEDPGQLLNDTHGLKRKGATISNQDGEEKGKDLRSRGLCLVPVSCTQHVGSENGADYWAPTYGSGF